MITRPTKYVICTTNVFYLLLLSNAGKWTKW